MNEVVFTDIELLSNINEGIGIICSLLIFFVIVILCYFAYKFFDMFFKI